MGKNLGTGKTVDHRSRSCCRLHATGSSVSHATEHGFKQSLTQTIADNIRLGLDLKGGTHLVHPRSTWTRKIGSTTDRRSCSCQRDPELPSTALAFTATVAKTDACASGGHHDHLKA